MIEQMNELRHALAEVLRAVADSVEPPSDFSCRGNPHTAACPPHTRIYKEQNDASN